MNKAGIRNQFLALLNRNDCTTDNANTFIEQGMARIQRTLRVPAMEAQEVITTNLDQGDTIVLPTDYLNMKYLYANDRMLEYKDFSNFLSIPAASGPPQYYTRIRGILKMKPYPAEGTEVNMIYYGEIPDLVEDTDENFLTVIAPDLLIYAALTFAADFFVDDRKQAFEDRFAEIYGEVEEQARLVEMDQSSIAMAPAYPYPY